MNEHKLAETIKRSLLAAGPGIGTSTIQIKPEFLQSLIDQGYKIEQITSCLFSLIIDAEAMGYWTVGYWVEYSAEQILRWVMLLLPHMTNDECLYALKLQFKKCNEPFCLFEYLVMTCNRVRGTGLVLDVANLLEVLKDSGTDPKDFILLIKNIQFRQYEWYDYERETRPILGSRHDFFIRGLMDVQLKMLELGTPPNCFLNVLKQMLRERVLYQEVSSEIGYEVPAEKFSNLLSKL